MGGLGDVNVHCIASSEDVVALQMLLRWTCCYVEDFVALKMLVVTLKMLLRWRCCCVEDVVTLKMLLRWRCCCEYFPNGFANVKKPSCAFRAWFAGDLWHFMSVKRNPEMQKKKAHNSYGTYKNNITIHNIQWKTQSCDSFWIAFRWQVESSMTSIAMWFWPNANFQTAAEPF
jgi:hypothetical protein